MAIGITKPTSQVGITTNAAVYSMAPSFLPPADSKLVVFAHASGTLLGSISGAGGIAWELAASLSPQGAGSAARIFFGDIAGDPSSVAINMNFTGDNATGCTAIALQVTGQDGKYVRQIVQVDSVGNNPVLTFPLPVDSNNAYMAVVIMNGALSVFAAPAGWTTVSASYGTPTTGLVVAYRAGGESAATFTLSTGALAGTAIFGLELWAQGAIPVSDPMGVMGVCGQ